MKAISKVWMGMLVMSVAAGAATPASAGVGDKIKKGLKKAAHAIEDGAKKVGHKIEEGAKKVGHQIEEGAKKAGEKLEEVGLAIKKGFESMSDKLRSIFSLKTLVALVKQAKQRWHAVKEVVQSAFHKVKAKAAEVAKSDLVQKAKGLFTKMHERAKPALQALENLAHGKVGKKLLKKIFLKVLRGEFDAELKADVRTLATSLGLSPKMSLASYDRRAPLSVCGFKDANDKTTPKSFSLTLKLSGSISKFISGGLDLQIGFVADLGKDDGRDYDIRGLFSIGVGVGVSKPGVDGSAALVLGISPQKVRDASGGQLGISGAFASPKVIGATAAVDWSIGGNMTAMPTFSAGILAGVPGGGVQLGGAWAFTFTKDMFCTGVNDKAACN